MANRTGRAGSRARSAVLAALVSVLCAGTACAQTLPDTLVRVYQNNPQLNAERARLRATDENVPQALSGYRPQLSAGLSAGVQGVKNGLPPGAVDPNGNPISTQSATLKPRMAGATITQPLFNGFK